VHFLKSRQVGRKLTLKPVSNSISIGNTESWINSEIDLGSELVSQPTSPHFQNLVDTDYMLGSVLNLL
jgi:hypothetical protein